MERGRGRGHQRQSGQAHSRFLELAVQAIVFGRRGQPTF